jgi:hypothetical protein
MTIEELGSLGEVVGAVAVIVTLFYLARQVRDNSAHVRAAAIIEINRLINEGFDPIYGNPDYLEVWFRGLESRTDLSDFDRNLFDLFMARIMNSYTTVLTQTRKGTIDPEDFVRYLGVYRGIAQSAGGQHWLNDIGMQLISEDAAKVLESADPRPLISQS